MPTDRFHISDYMARFDQRMTAGETAARLWPDFDRPPGPRSGATFSGALRSGNDRRA